MIDKTRINRFYSDVKSLDLKFPVAYISEATGFSKGVVSNYLKGTREPSENFINKFYEKYSNSIPRETIMQEPEDTYAARSTKLRLSLKHGTKSVPVTNGKAAAGTVALINDEPELILEYIDAPFLGIVEGVVECVGHSMYPTFPNGCRLAIKKLEDKALFNPGEFYFIIDNNYEGYVKRLYEDVDGVILVSENADQKKYPPFKRKWEHIVALFKVKADITKH